MCTYEIVRNKPDLKKIAAKIGENGPKMGQK